MADHVKPLKGFDGGVMEIVLRHRGDAFRVVYAIQIGKDYWVIHAFQKKSTQASPLTETDPPLLTKTDPPSFLLVN